MKRKCVILGLVLAASALSLSPTSAENRPDSVRAADRINDSGSTVKRASEVYQSMLSRHAVAKNLAKESKCVAVFPGVISAALGVGGFHGDGVALCRMENGAWGNPIFLDLSGASLGLQAGYKDADFVMFMKSPGAKAAIEKGDLELAGEFAAIAGELDEKYSAPSAGVVVYSRAEGVFAGASVNGIRLSRDNDEQKAFYGTYDRDSLWEGKIPPGVAASVKDLKDKLPA